MSPECRRPHPQSALRLLSWALSIQLSGNDSYRAGASVSAFVSTKCDPLCLYSLLLLEDCIFGLAVLMTRLLIKSIEVESTPIKGAT